jgi:hypothetical protein
MLQLIIFYIKSVLLTYQKIYIKSQILCFKVVTGLKVFMGRNELVLVGEAVVVEE